MLYFIHKTAILKSKEDKPICSTFECDGKFLSTGEWYHSRRKAKILLAVMAKEFVRAGYIVYFGRKNRKFIAIKEYSNGMLLYVNYKVHSTNILFR